MQKLEKIVKNNGTIHTQLERTEKAAIYETGRGDFEVFKIKTAPAQEIYGKEYPEREVYPSNEDFGSIAWYYMTKEKAYAMYNRIK